MSNPLFEKTVHGQKRPLEVNKCRNNSLILLVASLFKTIYMQTSCPTMFAVSVKKFTYGLGLLNAAEIMSQHVS